MDFDPLILLRIKNQNQEELDELRNTLDEYHTNPAFIFSLIQHLNVVGFDNIIKDLLIIEIKNCIRMYWSEDVFWSEYDKINIIQSLFQTIVTTNDSIRWKVTYIFDSLITKRLNNIWWYDILINFINTADASMKIYFIYIGTKIMKIHNRERKLLPEEFDSILFNVYNAYRPIFDSCYDNSPANMIECNICILIIKSLRYLIKNSSNIARNENLEMLTIVLIKLLNVQKQSDPFLELKNQILKLFQTMISEFYGSQSQSYILADPYRNAFAEQFKSVTIHQIISLIKQIATNTESKKINNTVVFIIYQILFYEIDLDIISQDLITYLINQCILQPSDIEEITTNPMMYKEQQLEFEIVLDRNLPRLICASIIRKIDEINPTVIETLIPSDTEEIQIIESKIFLISAIIWNRLKSGQDIPEELCEILVNICTECFNSDSNPIILSAFNLYSLIIPHYNPLEGVVLCENILVNDSTLENPLIGVFASKVIKKVIESEDLLPQINVPIVVDSLLKLIDAARSRTFFKLIQTICQNYSAFVVPFLSEIFNIFITGAEEYESDSFIAENSLETLYEILESFEDDEEIMMEIFKNIMQRLINIFYSCDENYPFGELLNIFVFFSDHIKSDMQDLYDVFTVIVNDILADENKADSIFMLFSKEFTLYVTPLFSERDSQYIATEEVISAFINMCSIWNSYLQDSINYGNSEICAASLTNFMFVLNIGIQTFEDNSYLIELLNQYHE